MRYGLKQFRKDFPTERACLDFIFETLHTPECACGGSYRYREGRKQYQCSQCRAVISPLVGTIFERSVVPLTQWFGAILSVHQGISIKGLQREIGTTYKTAWRCSHILRNAMQGDTIDLICIPTKSGTRKTKTRKTPTTNNGAKTTLSASAKDSAIASSACGLKFFLGTAKEYQGALVAEKQKTNFFRLTTSTGKAKKTVAIRGAISI